MKGNCIVTVGSVNMDLVTQVPRLPVWGECLMGDDFKTVPGGKGANQALAVARLGHPSVLVGRVGGDLFGSRLRADLEREGVDVSHLKVDPDAANGVALIFLDRQGRNAILVAGGANMRLTPEDVRQAEPQIAQASLLLVQLEVSREAVREAIGLAHRHHVPVILDPAPAHNFTADLMPGVFAAVPNETEAQTLTGIPCDTEAGAREAARKLTEMGARYGVVKLGERGLVYTEGKEVRVLPAFAVEAVDTTAAGDAFAAGLAVAVAEGASLAEALSFASACGALAVTKFGAQPSMPMRAAVEEFRNSRN